MWKQGARMAAGVGVIMALTGANAAAAATTTLGHPGYVILAGAADTTAGYRWRQGPGPGQRSLVWPHGVLTVPEAFACEPFGTSDLAVAVSAELGGAGAGGGLAFTDGRYTVSEPLHLGDGRVSFYLAAGELEIHGGRIRYAPPPAAARDARAGLLFLGGMVILVAVSLRLARRSRAPGARP
jgi:hypothetical protein